MRSAVKAGLALAVLLVVAYLFAVPAHTYLDQKSAVALERKTISVLHHENANLSAEARDLNNDATIEQIARQDYGLVKPGQQAFMVVPSKAPAAARPDRPRPVHHWYSELEFWRFL